MECKMEPIIPYTLLPHVLRAQTEVSPQGPARFSVGCVPANNPLTEP